MVNHLLINEFIVHGVLMSSEKNDTKSSHTSQVLEPVKENFFSKGSQSAFSTAKDSYFFSKTTSSIQTKLTVGAPDDAYEKEADAMANNVVQRLSAPEALSTKDSAVQAKPIGHSITPIVQSKCDTCEKDEKLQREEEVDEENRDVRRKPIFESNAEPPPDAESIQSKCAQCEKEEKLQKKAESSSSPASADLESSLMASKGSGASLAMPVRQEMESSFGTDFSNVRIHTGSNAEGMNKGLHAQAFTHGNDIYFNSGKFDTNSNSGKQLLAHELTHTIQQGHSKPAGVQCQPQPENQPKIDESYYEFIPTCTLNITLGNVYFVLSPDATFQPGPKIPQVLGIILKKLIGKQFKTDLIKPVQDLLLGDKEIQRIGHLRGKQNAYEREPIGNLLLSISVFYKLTSYLNKKGFTGSLTQDEKDKIQLAIHTIELWISIIGEYKRFGMTIPKWFDKDFFDNMMQLHMTELKDYDEFLTKHADDDTVGSRTQGMDKFNVIFTLVQNDVDLLESFRVNTSLMINPVTQLAYKSIWNVGKNVALSRPPDSINSVNTALALLLFASKNTDLAKFASVDDAAMIRFIEFFLREHEIPEEEMKILPPFPSFVVAPDLNSDNSTVTTAKNEFRMITQFEEIYGTNLLHGATVAMQMTMYYSWNVYKMPESLKKMKDQGTSPSDMVTLSNEFIKNSPANLGEPVNTYKPDESRERRIKMSGIGTGDFVLMGIAAPTYTKQMNRVQKPSTAGYTFSVFNAADLAKTSAYADWDLLTKYKNQLATETDPDKKKELEAEIQRLSKRESTDLLTLTKEDIADTKKMLVLANELKKIIEDDYKENKPFYGNKNTNPFNIRLREKNQAAYDLYMMIRETFPFGKYSDREAVDKYIEILNKQKDDLGNLQDRSQVAYDSFKPGSPTYRVVAGLVKEDDGNLVPLIMVAGYHPDSDPEHGKYKIKLVDVTFDAPKKGDMIYVGDEIQAEDKVSGEKQAVDSAFDKFAGYHHYGKGYIIYRLPGTNYSGGVNSYTTARTYLGYAIAALGLVLLVAGIIATAGALTPAAAAVVAALGVGVGVVGAVMSIQNIQERKEKGVLEWDAETALDIINIIAGVVVAVGAIVKITQVVSKSVTLLLAIERAKGLYMVYDAVNIAANVYLIHEKAKEDVAAIKRMKLPKYEEDELISQVTFDAIQQGAMLAVSAYTLARGAQEHFQSKVSGASYHSWEERGWIAERNGRLIITEDAPPFLKAKMSLFGTAPKGEETGKGTTTEQTGDDTKKTTTTTDDPTTQKPPTVGEPEVTKPQTFQEKIAAMWQSRLKVKPPMLDTCIKKLQNLKVAEEDILKLVNNGLNHERPNQFFGDLNVYLKLGEGRVGTGGFNKILEGLATTNNFDSASILMQNAASNKDTKVKSIADNLSMEAVTALRKRMPPMNNPETVANLRRIAEHVDASTDDVIKLMDVAGTGEEGLEKFNRAVDRLGEGRFTPDKIKESLNLGVEIEKAIAAGGGATEKKLWGDAKEITLPNGKKVLEVSAQHTAESSGDKAYAHIKGMMDEIVNSVLAPGGQEVDPVKWGVARAAIERTDLPDLTKNQIIGEMWAASNVAAYEKQGYAVYREVTIQVVDAQGKKMYEAHLDAVLVKGDEVLYKEFKSSETASTSKDQVEVYNRLASGKIGDLRPKGPRALKAFGGAKFPKFVAKPVDFNRPK